VSWLSKLFGKEEKKGQVEQPQQSIPSPVPQKEWICKACNGTIDPGERWSKFQGQYYHKQCYKQLKNGVFNGN
jgi:hypothetical protein